MIKYLFFRFFIFSNHNDSILRPAFRELIRELMLFGLLILKSSIFTLKLRNLSLLWGFTCAGFVAVSVFESVFLARVLVHAHLALEMIYLKILWILTCASFVAVVQGCSCFVALSKHLRLKSLDFVIFGCRVLSRCSR